MTDEALTAAAREIADEVGLIRSGEFYDGFIGGVTVAILRSRHTLDALSAERDDEAAHLDASRMVTNSYAARATAAEAKAARLREDLAWAKAQSEVYRKSLGLSEIGENVSAALDDGGGE